MLSLPPFARALLERQRFHNLPSIVFITVGLYCWERAKYRNTSQYFYSLVYPGKKPPSAYTWPVRGCNCIIEVAEGPDEKLIDDLARALLSNGVKTVNELFVGFTQLNEMKLLDSEPDFVSLPTPGRSFAIKKEEPA